MTSPKVSIILPVYNQAGFIGPTVHEYLEALEGLPCASELILVVNGPCKDDSLGVCRKIEKDEDRVRLVSSESAGWGHAVRLGMGAADGDFLCYTNSARTAAHDLELLILYALVHPETVIKANRKIRDSLVRRLGSLLYNLECRMLFDLPYWDINGTPKVFPRKLGELLSLTREDDLIDLEFNVICREQGYPVIEVPILSSLRRGGCSTTNLRSAYRLYTGALALWYRKRGNTR